jgi:hypothetical protein
MKKAFISLTIFTAVSSANALDFGTSYSRDITNDTNGYGIQVSESWNRWSLTAQADRFESNQDQVSVLAGYQIAKIWKLIIDAQAGAAYIQADNSKDGLTSVVGLSASVPIIKNISVTGDIRRQIGQASMKQYDGTSLGVGIKYKF